MPQGFTTLLPISLVPPRTTIFKFRSGFRCLVFHNQWHHPRLTILSNPTLVVLVGEIGDRETHVRPRKGFTLSIFPRFRSYPRFGRGEHRFEPWIIADASLQRSIGKVTIALPLRSVDAATYGFSGVQFLETLQL